MLAILEENVCYSGERLITKANLSSWHKVAVAKTHRDLNATGCVIQM